MGRRGIDHRDIEGVIRAFEISGKDKWGIFAGSSPVICNDDLTGDASKEQLEEILQALEQGEGKTQYELRVYHSNAPLITNKTAHAATTTFMLNKDVPIKTENGLTIIDRGAPGRQYDSSYANRLTALENENRDLREKLHKEELNRLEDKMNNAIAGITNANEPKPWDERLIGIIESKPEIISEILRPIGNLISGIMDRLAPRKDYIINNPAPNIPAMNGTESKEEDTEMKTETGPTGPMGPGPHPQGGPPPLSKEELEKMYEQQDADLEAIEARIGPQVLTKLISTVAGMDDKQLNKLLNYLD